MTRPHFPAVDPDTKLPSAAVQAAWANITSIASKVDQDHLPKNILRYGVSRGTSASQTTAIKAALDAYPGEAFFFPPGDYRLDTSLLVSQSNSLILAEGARIYAAVSMDKMIYYAPALAGGQYAEDKCIIGGLLDGNLLASKILSIKQILRFTLTRSTFRNGINRGLVTESGAGAELFAYDLRFHNTTIGNVSDNVAIEANMGDSHFRDIIIRDWTVGVVDTGANRWAHVHPWIGPDIGAVTQMTSRYPTSIAFDLSNSSDLIACLSDTYRYGFKFRTNGTGYTAPPRLLNCRATWSSSTLPDALATANPAYVFDNSDSIGAIVDRTTVTGHSVVPGNFLTGPAANLAVRDTFSYGYIKGYSSTVGDPLDYRNSAVQGTFTFTPTIFGSTGNGTHSYTVQTGRMVVNGDVATYFVRVAGTLDATTAFAGALRIGGLPLPPGSTNVRDGAGVIGRATNFQTSNAVIFAGTSPAISVMVQLSTTGHTEVDIPGQSMRGKTVDIMVAISVTHFKS